jgi:hypothetical protein
VWGGKVLQSAMPASALAGAHANVPIAAAVTEDPNSCTQANCQGSQPGSFSVILEYICRTGGVPFAYVQAIGSEVC